MGFPTPQYSASATGRFMMYQGNIPVIVDAATARGGIGATAIGEALLTAANEAAAFAALPSSYHKANILGTVSQSSGVPTGAIIESGSNANGRYIKYADGTMICHRRNITYGPVNQAVGSVFQGANLTVTFPATFSENPTVTVGSDSANTWASGFDISSTQARLGLWCYASLAETRTISYMAIGRWF